jgi:hypothetical protein
MVRIVHNKGQHSTIKGNFGGAAYVEQMVPERNNPACPRTLQSKMVSPCYLLPDR